MPHLIKSGALQVDDCWQVVSGEASPDPAALPDEPALVPLSFWLAQRDQLAGRVEAGTLGVWFDSHEEPEALAEDCHRFPVIAVHFPIFTDGRGYSIAHLLRTRYGFTGEIRAIGDVLVDQVFYMKRCGIDAFALRDDKSPTAAIAALDTFSESYQGSVDEPRPLFRRRLH